MAKAKKQSEGWRNRIIGEGVKPASAFTPNALNFRRHPNAQRNALRGVLNEVGWIQRVIENVRTGNLIDGHARIEEALSRDENEPVPYIQVDVSPEEEKLLLATLDPLSAMATSDKETLDALLREVSAGDAAVQSMLSALAEDNGLYFGEEKPAQEAPEIEPDRADELQEKWKVQRGDLYVIGIHRLLCGDSTSAEDMARLMDGKKASMVFTDPPYAIYGSSTGAKNDDNMIQPFFREVWKRIRESGAMDVYCCCDWRSYPTVERTCAGYDIKDVIIWDKGCGGLGNPYRRRHEFVVFARPAISEQNMFLGYEGECRSITDDDVWQIQRVTDKSHNAQKPVELAARAITNSSEAGGLVFEPFGGSGTTLAASEGLGRSCYAMEISEKFCALILERMTLMGLTPELRP